MPYAQQSPKSKKRQPCFVSYYLFIYIYQHITLLGYRHGARL